MAGEAAAGNSGGDGMIDPYEEQRFMEERAYYEAVCEVAGAINRGSVTLERFQADLEKELKKGYGKHG